MTLLVVLLLGAGSILILDAFSADPKTGQPEALGDVIGGLWAGQAPAIGGAGGGPGAPINNPTAAADLAHKGVTSSGEATAAGGSAPGAADWLARHHGLGTAQPTREQTAASEWVARGRG